MTKKKIFRSDLLIEWMGTSLWDDGILWCRYCPVFDKCNSNDDCLCNPKYKEEFKKTVIEIFSSDVEVVYNGNHEDV